MKKWFTLISAAVLSVGMSATAFAAEINVTVDGAPVAWTDAKPFIDENDRTLVPLRPIANALGLDVTWNANTNTAAFTNGTDTVSFTVGADTYRAFLNKNPDFNAIVSMDTKAVIKDSRIYAPARYLAEAFLYDVGWEQATQTVTITKMSSVGEFEEIPIELPAVPEGAQAAAFPMTIAAGETAYTTVAVNGITFKEDADIFSYEITRTSDIDLLSEGVGFAFEDGYLEFDLQPYLSAEPGTYELTWTLPAEWFIDAKEDVVVSTTLTITAPTAASALEYAKENMDTTLFAAPGSTTAEVTELFLSTLSELFDGTGFTPDVTKDVYNETAGTWNAVLTVSNDSDSASETLSIPVENPDAFFGF